MYDTKLCTMTIEDFEIGEELGEGAFGIVYGGVCKRTGKPVAIKIEKEVDVPTSFVKHEAQVLLALKGCKGVPALLGYGVISDHRYLITPLLERSLSDMIRADGPLSGMDALTIHGQVRKVLKGIHKKGFVHRDVKPDNIMFSGDDVYLIDYGCATNYRIAERRHRAESRSPNNRTPPKSSSYVGTYEYLGELGRQGCICCEVDFEGLDKSIEASMLS